MIFLAAVPKPKISQCLVRFNWAKADRKMYVRFASVVIMTDDIHMYIPLITYHDELCRQCTGGGVDAKILCTWIYLFQHLAQNVHHLCGANNLDI